jgi:bleomycin hydrolase
MGAESSKPVMNHSETNECLDEKLSLQFVNLNIEDIKSASSDLSVENITKFSKNFHQDSKNLLAMNAMAGNDPTGVFLNPKSALNNDQHIFNVKLDLEGSATNQKSSGRCWLFAGTNIMRLAVISKYKLSDDFELSQSYLFFYGKKSFKW